MESKTASAGATRPMALSIAEDECDSGALSVGPHVNQLAVLESEKQIFVVEARPAALVFPASLDACQGLLYNHLRSEEKFANPLATGKYLSHRNQSQLRATN